MIIKSWNGSLSSSHFLYSSQLTADNSAAAFATHRIRFQFEKSENEMK